MPLYPVRCFPHVHRVGTLRRVVCSSKALSSSKIYNTRPSITEISRVNYFAAALSLRFLSRSPARAISRNVLAGAFSYILSRPIRNIVLAPFSIACSISCEMVNQCAFHALPSHHTGHFTAPPLV